MIRAVADKIRVTVALLGFCACAWAGQFEREIRFDIQPQSLASAVLHFAEQSQIQVVTSSGQLEQFQTKGLKGSYSVRSGLSELLSGTGLTFQEVGNGTVSIGKEAATSLTPANDSLRLTQGDEPESDSAVGSASTPVSQEDLQLQEIVVTAQKRIERLQDVPVPVTAINADSLVNSNQMQLQEYYTRIPALSLVPSVWGPIIAIRGVTTGGLATSPTVGIVVDDVPFGSSTGVGGGAPVPDFDPSDLARVEVLRGPQGTFYGAASIGGLLKYVTADPSTKGFSGRLQAGTDSIKNGDGLGYSMRGSVNVPIRDTFAIRASGYTRREQGYIDDPGLGIEGVNTTDVDGGRLSALWQPSDDLSLKLSALIQKTHSDGAPDTFAGFADLTQGYSIPAHGAFDRKMQAYLASLTAKLGPAELTAISGYSSNDLEQFGDATASFGELSQDTFGFPYTDVFNFYKTNKFTQEVRFAMPLAPRIDWLMGAFYTHEKTAARQIIQAVEDRDTLVPAGLWIDGLFPSSLAEYAAFTDFTFKFTERFDLQVGGRESHNRQSYDELDTGAFVGGELLIPQIVTRDNSFTYLMTPRFRISTDLMVYARLASGYRAGGPNSCTVVPAIPCHFDPDETLNYEIGLKGATPNHLLSFDASVYYIDWKDIQIQVQDPATFFVYFVNAGSAKSQGAEISADLRPLPGMTLSAWVAWNDAELTEGLPSTGLASGRTGDRLPYSSPFSANLSLDQEFPLGERLSGFAGASVSYVGDRKGDFPASALLTRPAFPEYVKVDLRLGLTSGPWNANVFVNNLADRRGVLFANPNTSFAISNIQPRTIGVALSRSF